MLATNKSCHSATINKILKQRVENEFILHYNLPLNFFLIQICFMCFSKQTDNQYWNGSQQKMSAVSNKYKCWK